METPGLQGSKGAEGSPGPSGPSGDRGFSRLPRNSIIYRSGSDFKHLGAVAYFYCEKDSIFMNGISNII